MQFGVIVLTTSAGIMVSHCNMCRTHAAIAMLSVVLHVLQSIVLTSMATAYVQDHEEARRKKVGGKVLGFFY